MDRYRQTKRIALLGISVNILLLGLKLAAGYVSRSQAMIADGFNSAGDVFASAMTYAGNRIASRPEDQEHPYGHGKAEYIFSMIISFSLLLVAYKIFRDSVDTLREKTYFTFSWWLLATALFTIVLKLSLFLYTRNAGTRHQNLLIIANSEDHRNDVFVTGSTLLGLLLGRLGIPWADGAIGIGISLWIAYTGARIFISAYRVLMDTSFDEGLRLEIVKAIESIQGVDHVDNVSAKPTGVGFIVITKISVPGSLTVQEGHKIAAQIRRRIRRCKNVDDVIVHVNPA